MPLADGADAVLTHLAQATGSSAIAELRGATLLGERAMLANSTIPGLVSAGGGCRLYAALGDHVAINLARPDDRALLPALFENDTCDINDDEAVAAQVAQRNAALLIERGRCLGMAIAAENEVRASSACPGVRLERGCAAARVRRAAPRVLDLSALWAGPLAAHLLWLAGAEVIKVESRTRPDAMRTGNASFFNLLNQGKARLALDFADPGDRQALLSLIAGCDIVIEAARPRALLQLGVDVARIVNDTPGLVWMTITAHGVAGEAANWVGFGDDCGVTAGLSAALRSASGCGGFVGDAIADPLAGISTASIAWARWHEGCGGRYGVALADVVAEQLASARLRDPAALTRGFKQWSRAVGGQFPRVERRRIGTATDLGAGVGSARQQWQRG